jgi:hypothetical protein
MTALPAVFWGEISPCEHLVQIYSEDAPFLDALVAFVAGGIQAGEAVIVIATPEHRVALRDRLRAEGIDVAAAIATDLYIALDAEATLRKFMVDGWPDDMRFNYVIHDILARARGTGRRVRAFGEMVAILWGQGHNGATVRLEHLWNELCGQKSFALFCAYPRAGFTQDTTASLEAICAAHTRVVA